MTGLDHKRAELKIREKFALTKDAAERILASIRELDCIGGCVIISTCNRTELYASVTEDDVFEPTRALCEMLGESFSEYGSYFTEENNELAIRHLCRVASGLDSRITGDDQIITQVREALEFSRERNCTDSYVETMFKFAIKAAKMIKTNVVLKTLGIDSVPGKMIEKLKRITPLTGLSAVVIGNGQMGRLVSELLIREGAAVTVTLREYKKGVIQVPVGARAINYSLRYEAIENADIVVSATTSPHYTLQRGDLAGLARLPEIIVDLAVPRDVEPSVQELPGVMLLGIDDISGDGRVLPHESIFAINEIIDDQIEKYYRWLVFKQSAAVR